MEIAVVPDFFCGKVERQELADAGEHGGTPRQQGVGHRARTLRQRAAPVLEIVERALDQVGGIDHPGPQVRRRDRFGRERRIAPARSQRPVQLRQPPADLPHAQQIGRMLVGVGDGVRRQQAILFEKTVEVGAGERPAVSLVLDEPLHDGEGGALVAPDELDRRPPAAAYADIPRRRSGSG